MNKINSQEFINYLYQKMIGKKNMIFINDVLPNKIAMNFP